MPVSPAVLGSMGTVTVNATVSVTGHRATLSIISISGTLANARNAVSAFEANMTVLANTLRVDTITVNFNAANRAIEGLATSMGARTVQTLSGTFVQSLTFRSRVVK